MEKWKCLQSSYDKRSTHWQAQVGKLLWNIKPYTLKYIDEHEWTTIFRYLLCKQWQTTCKGWGNRVSYVKTVNKSQSKWDNGTPKTIWERVWKEIGSLPADQVEERMIKLKTLISWGIKLFLSERTSRPSTYD